MAAVRRGNSQARGTMFDRHALRLHALATSILGSRADAEDILHDTFLYAFERIHELQKPSALRSWLSQVLVRKALSLLRRQKRGRRIGLHVVVPEEQYVQIQGPDHEAALRVPDARQLLENMAPDMRVVWWLQRVEGHTMNEVADLTGLSIDQVKKRLVAGEAKMAAYRKGQKR